ncbi:MAG TPA: hypothetical protein VGH27_01220 [Streptosporangiaceae bacterium]|jgi:hypothetical protein
MLQARVSLITLDPDGLGDSVKFIEDAVCPEAEQQHGSLGVALYANAELGVVLLESFWATQDALRLAEQRITLDFPEELRRASGTVCIERYRVPVFESDGPLRAGDGLQLTRMDFDPSRVEDAVEVYGDTVVPWLAGTEGFRGTLLLVNRESGNSISEAVWRDDQAMAGSRSTAAAMRANTCAATGGTVRTVEEYGLVSTSIRKP